MLEVITFLASRRSTVRNTRYFLLRREHERKGRDTSNNLEKRHLAPTLAPFLCALKSTYSTGFIVISLQDIIFRGGANPRHFALSSVSRILLSHFVRSAV